MTEILRGNPDVGEAVAILAAVQAVLEGEGMPIAQTPWAYRSVWRRVAIEEGTWKHNLGGWSVS